ncbi:MAG: HD family phosphohydrolase [Anaerolineaceae bacterium]
MNYSEASEKLKSSGNRKVIRIVMLVFTSILALASLSYPIAIRPDSYPLQVGDVAQQDILAPHSLTYLSEAQTELARKEAEKSVSPIFLPADPGIARQQIENLKGTIEYINSVRLDSFSTIDQKIIDLQKINEVSLTSAHAERLLTLSDDQWTVFQEESLNVLEEIMRNPIRQDQRNQAQRNIPTLISFSMAQDQAEIVSELVTPFVIANSLFSEEQTKSAIEAIRSEVEPVSRIYLAGETIVRRGQIITPLTWEALQEFGLIQPKREFSSFVSIIAIVAVLSVLISLYISRRKISPINDLRSLLMITILFLVFLYGARLVIPNRTVIPYLFPISAFGLTIACLYNLEVGLVFSLILSILSGFGLSNSADLTMFYILPSMVGILILGKGRRVANFFWAGIAIGVSGSAIILAYRLQDYYADWFGLATLFGTAFLNGLASASLTLIIQFLFSQLLGLTTALQLLELSRPDHPLLQFMLRNAPGSYQHSLQVANLVELAAESIGADALLSRVGSIYHDVGKAANPSYFIENQVTGKNNPHDEIDPIASAGTIIQHIEDGLKLARKHRLPPKIMDFMREHHGTLLARYQYAKALQAVNNNPDEVDENKFRYPGPSPRSKETALLMLADGCEARARAELPKNEEEIREMVKKVFDLCQREGQLDETNLTLRDLHIAAESFVTTLKNIYHPRIQYPEITAVKQPKLLDIGRDYPSKDQPTQAVKK